MGYPFSKVGHVEFLFFVLMLQLHDIVNKPFKKLMYGAVNKGMYCIPIHPGVTPHCNGY